MTKKKIAVVVFFVMFLVLGSYGIWAADMKVSSDIGVRIRNVQLDQSRVQTQMLQLQQQYQAMQEQMKHDQGELDSLKKEAIAEAKLDATYDVDLEKLIFVPKPKPAAKVEEKK